jgi:hypothetical protein
MRSVEYSHRGSTMENVANIVNNVLDARGWRGKVLEQMAVEIWPEVVGPDIARHTLAQKFKSGTLYIRARSPQWTHELHFHEARIIARINGRLRQNLVHKIRCSVTPPRGIKVGALKPNWEDPTFPATPPPPRAARVREDDEASRHAAEIVAQSNIEDEEVKLVMQNLIAASIRAREDKKSQTKN